MKNKIIYFGLITLTLFTLATSCAQNQESADNIYLEFTGKCSNSSKDDTHSFYLTIDNKAYLDENKDQIFNWKENDGNG